MALLPQPPEILVAFSRERNGHRDVSSGSILLKKVFRGVEQIFSEAPVRPSENDVGGHIIRPISNQRPS